MNIQIISISDWHAQIDPLTSPVLKSDGGTQNVGGASGLSAWFQKEKATNPNTLFVTAGDEFGASPPVSALNNEDPAVKSLNLMGIQVSTFGNHNFDRGTTHLQQMITLATYKYVSTNLNNLTGTLTGVASPFTLVDVGGVKVGIVGITNVDAESLIAVGRLGPITVDAMAPSVTKANAAAVAAKAAGANIVVALVHMGADFVAADGGVSGPLLTFAGQLTGFAAVLGDHTDIVVNTSINGVPVVENRSKGVTYARVSMTVHTGTNAVTNTQVTLVDPFVANFFPDGGNAIDPAIETMLAPYRAQVAVELDKPIGKTTGVYVRNGVLERTQEVPVGDLTADAIRLRYGSTLALTNSGGLRSPLPSSYVPADAGTLVRTGCSSATPCDLLRGDVQTLLPFGNIVVTRTVTGAQLWSALEWGVGAMPAANGRFPQISGFKFNWSTTADAGSRVLSVTLADGGVVPNDAGSVYSLATNDFTNGGGDGYLMFRDQLGVSREVMADVVADFIRDAGTISPVDAGRILPQ